MKKYRRMSRPARGGWIEIPYQSDSLLSSMSRPARGGWIEIAATGYFDSQVYVPPRTGRVD